MPPEERMCSHKAWLEASFSTSFELLHSTRLRDINNQLKDPQNQRPSLLFCIGDQERDAALLSLFPHNSLKQNRSSLVNIDVDNASLLSDHPLLFADSPAKPRLSSTPYAKCHDQDIVALNWKRFPPDLELVDLIYCRLFFLFTDVICVFVEDFTDYQSAVDRVTLWLSLEDCSALPTNIRPCVILVTSGHGDYHDMSSEILQEHPTVFRRLELVQLRAKEPSAAKKYRPLRDLILQRMDTLRADRIKSRTLFSAAHIAYLFRRRFWQFARSPSQCFDFIHASRYANPIRSEFETFLGTFTLLAMKSGFPEGDISSILASTILMNAFPPLMHKFEPTAVFRRLYRSKCLRMLQRIVMPDAVERFCNLIERYIISFFPVVESDRSAADLHRQNLKQFSQKFRSLRSPESCLSCLSMKPRHGLSCGHSMCDNCVKIFGRRVPGFEQAYEVRACVVCGTPSDLRVFLKPPTAGVRIISVSSLGDAAMVGLMETTRMLHQAFGAGCDVLSFVDFAFGVGTGGLAANALFNTSDVGDLVSLMGRAGGGQRSTTVLRSQSFGHLRATLSALSKLPMKRLLKQIQCELPSRTSASRTHVAFVVQSLARVYRNYAQRSTDPERPQWPGLPFDTPLSDLNSGRSVLEYAIKECLTVWPGAPIDVALSLEQGKADQQLERASVSALANGGGHRVEAEDSERTSALANCFRVIFSPRTAMLRGRAVQRVVRQQLSNASDLLEICRALLVSSFFFELHAIPTPKGNDGMLQCFGCVRCRVSAVELRCAFAKLVEVPWRLSVSGTNFGDLSPEKNICEDCGRYAKRIQFPINHKNQVITMYAREGSGSTRLLSGFPQRIEWFVREQKLQNDFGREDHSLGFGWLCPSCDAPNFLRKF